MPRMPRPLKIPIVDRLPGPEDLVLCVRVEDMPTAVFDDDMQAPCIACGKAVRFRPYMAAGQKICGHCAPGYVGKRH